MRHSWQVPPHDWFMNREHQSLETGNHNWHVYHDILLLWRDTRICATSGSHTIHQSYDTRKPSWDVCNSTIFDRIQSWVVTILTWRRQLRYVPWLICVCDMNKWWVVKRLTWHRQGQLLCTVEPVRGDYLCIHKYTYISKCTKISCVFTPRTLPVCLHT